MAEIRSEGRLADAADRETAVTDFDRNLVVVAGAGTGKTSLLVERILVAVLVRQEPLGEIAAITFTEKAASELRIRIAAELEVLRHLISGREPPRSESGAGRAARATLERLRGAAAEPAELQGRVLAALEQVDGAAIGTIHSFCAELLRRHPQQAGVVPGFKVDDGLYEDELLQELSAAWLERELGPETPRPQLWEHVLDHFTVEQILEVARLLIRARIPEAALEPGRIGADPLELLRPTLELWHTQIADTLRRGSGFNPNMVGFLETACELCALLLDQGFDAFRKRAAAPSSAASFWNLARDPPAVGSRAQQVDPTLVRRLAKRSRRLLCGLRHTEPALLADLIELVRPLVIEVREKAQERGWVSFDALLALARDLLRDHPAVRRAQQRAYRRLLVDEFQDTDPLQYEIVLYLAQDPEDDLAQRDAYRVRLEPGKLFIVGDPKQSIYRFRGADVGAYQRAIETILAPGDPPLRLVSNFRAPAALLGPLDRVFGAAFAPAAGVQPPYEPIVAAPERAPAAAAIELISVPSADSPRPDRDLRRRREGEAVALLIEELTGAPGRPGPFRHGDIAILFSSTKDVALYLRALHERDLPFVAEGGKAFYTRPEVMDLLGLLRAIANPNDAMAIVTVLRSPLGGAPDAELATYAAAGGRWSYQAWPGAERAPAPELAPNIARCFTMLRQLRQRALELPPDALAQELLDQTPLLALHAAAFEGAQRVANLLLLAERAAQLARSRMRSLEQLIAAVERDSADGSQQGDSPLADETVDAVRILTIHKAKGLEFPVVIVPDLARRPGGDEREAWGAKLLAGDRLALRCGELCTPAELLRQALERDHEQAESIRLFYVACTRAQARLYLVQADFNERQGWLPLFEPWGLLAGTGLPDDGPLPAEPRVRLRTLALRPRPRALAPLAAIDLEAAIAVWNRGRARALDLGRSWRVSPSGLREEAEARADQLEESWRHAGSAGRALGLAAHALLEVLDPAAPEPPAERLRASAVRAADSAGADPNQVERELRELWRRIDGSPLLERLRRWKVLGRELAVFAPQSDGRLLRGYIDLLARDEHGELVVVDYKTDHASAAEAAIVAQRYRPQLQAYAGALQQALKLPQPPRCEVWLLRLGACIDLDSDSPQRREHQLDLFS
ncbi:MAG TPA: UvrD-helicase domain-containing protein [Acidobacteriota bacterium]